MAKIVLVEDEPALQKSLGDFLRAQGHDVHAALNGEDGLQLVKRERPDLVLLDLVLPRMSGLDTLRAIRADQEIADTRVIVLTNLESTETVEQAVELGAKAYLVKTQYNLDEVREKLESVLAAS